MEIPDFTTDFWPLLVTLGFFIVIAGRYFLMAGLFYGIFYLWFPAKWKERKISTRNYPKGQFKKEMKWSLVNALLFSVAGMLMVLLWQKGYTQVYTDVNAYPLWYLPASLIIFMLLHETYYYWLHRWMHRPGVYRIVHKVHHDSHIASPFTAFSFHPIEGILQAVFMPVMLLILPMHYCVIVVALVIMTFSSVINHLDIEIYPKNSYRFWGKWIIGASHHSLHHKEFRYNYGLYFTFWDKLKKTESPGFKNLFKTLTGTQSNTE